MFSDQADSGYVADRVATAATRIRIRIQIVHKPKDQVGFVTHAGRWAVERFFAWIGRNRRFAKDFEASVAATEAFLCAASVMRLTRRLARSR